ncbi:DinB family protein [Chryseobacterium indologenes]|uniref:DinB-like domain-containing protein n=1 Tax=Chryseobacterium indologenes TaxID=253 RepID=A0A0N0ZZG1_CHRID|nr:DinB family protein [Chryseobacterium indologenes]KPE52419.1 hypothetical protein AOB46_06000 [Chryseobacterium indologenes]
MKISSAQLILDLQNTVQNTIQTAENLKNKPENELNFRTSENSWSALECLEHLNRYGHFYIPEITHRISASETSARPVFISGILGNYFAGSMLPKEKLNPMKTFKSMNPLYSRLDKSTVDEFIRQQHQMWDLLEKAKNIDLSRTKTSISISKFIKLKLGDTFRFVINHNIRHLVQAERVLKNI